VTTDTTFTLSAAQADHSRFVQRVRRRYGELLPLLPAGVPDVAAIGALIATLSIEHGHALGSALRIARHLVIERLAVIDVEQRAAMEVVTATMTALAEATLEAALAQVRQETTARYGTPRNPAGAPIEFWIVGMGKLGAREQRIVGHRPGLRLRGRWPHRQPAGVGRRRGRRWRDLGARVLHQGRPRPVHADR
jgi:glutamate-ammonia-ligase adenylyltransferase